MGNLQNKNFYHEIHKPHEKRQEFSYRQGRILISSFVYLVYFVVQLPLY